MLAALDDERASVLVRALQEALTNVGRHAGERPRVDARLLADAGVVRLEVVDDGGRVGGPGGGASAGGGSGPDVLPGGEPGRRPGGFGLRGMRERVEALGGTVEAGPRGTGWAVVVELPRGAS